MRSHPLARTASALLVAATIVALPAPAFAQGDRALDVTEAILDRFFTAHEKEKAENGTVSTQVSDADAKINKFEQCKRDYEAVAGVAGGRLAQIAARAAIKAKCGATDSEAMRKERQKLMDGPETAGATAGGFKLAEYRSLRDNLRGYVAGDRSGFTTASLPILKSRDAQLAKSFGMSAVVDMDAMGGRGGRGPAVWNTDYAWIWISQMFAMQYLSGATMFEKDYAVGEWTQWAMLDEDGKPIQSTERAFLGKTADGGEWWRMKTITHGDDADTVTLEALFKPEEGNEGMQKLVRMRGKLPGNKEAQEMMVPEQWSSWNMMGSFSGRPTPESIAGATVGTEQVKTAAGTFSAKHVRFGQGGGTLNWWLDDATTGGWVKFALLDDDKKPRYSMELAAKGTGAKSELGVEVK
jgi:hypothetical protein